MDEWDLNREYHDTLIQNEAGKSAHVEECKNTPLFSVEVAKELTVQLGGSPFPQYGLLAKREKVYSIQDTDDREVPDPAEKAKQNEPKDDRIFMNMNVPLSVFLCGSQGSGKSHTLSCMLESALKDSRLGKLAQPMAGIVFHFDRFSRWSNHEPCEAAYLCSTGIPVNVLVPMTSIELVEESYKSLPGLPADGPRPMVCPLLLREKHLDISTMLTLMKVDPESGGSSLYMEVCHPSYRA